MSDPDTSYPRGIERTSVLAVAVGPRLAEALDELAALDAVPGLAPLVRWAPAGEGVSLVHRLPLGARTLAELRAEGPLRLGEAAAVGRALVAPLRALHGAGLAHGAVGIDTVVVGSAEGEPVLAATGVGWAVPPGQVGGPDPAVDVAALAELVRHLVGLTPLPAGLVLVLLRCADDDPSLRPTLDDLDRALAACELVGDEGVRPPARLGTDDLVRGPSSSVADPGRASVLDLPRALRPDGSRSRRRRRARLAGRPGWVLLGSALMAAVLLARVVGLPTIAEGAAAVPAQLVTTATSTPTSAPTSTPTTTPSARERPRGTSAPEDVVAATSGTLSREPAPGAPSAREIGSRADWAAVLTTLDRTRHAAIVTGSRTALARAVDPQGPAWAADAALADRVREQGARIAGGEVRVVTADLTSLEERRALLTVVDTRAPYDVTVDGTTARVPARAAAVWSVVLTRTSDGTWRIHDVRPAS